MRKLSVALSEVAKWQLPSNIVAGLDRDFCVISVRNVTRGGLSEGVSAGCIGVHYYDQ